MSQHGNCFQNEVVLKALTMIVDDLDDREIFMMTSSNGLRNLSVASGDFFGVEVPVAHGEVSGLEALT